MEWPSFRRTLGYPTLVISAVLHVATRTVELVALHLLYEPKDR